MSSRSQIVFSPFHLDLVNERLWHGSQMLALRPKIFAVLRYLVEHSGQLVTKEALRQAVWPDPYGSQGLLKGCIRELRRVLGDQADAPRFIETVGRRGYRFIAPLTAAPVSSSPTGHPPRLPPVGREAEVAQLHRWLEQALAGARQVVFVTGEPGIGKTTVVDTFLAQVEADLRTRFSLGPPPEGASPATRAEIWMARGQCVEHYGAGEAYLPVLEALGRLGREAGGERLIALLGRYAPTWLVQMPALVSDAELEGVQRRVQGATRERMLRELAEALDALTAETPLILVLEDLQWSDYATIDLISSLAQRRGRLLLIGTYRPAEVIVSNHPLRGVKQELHAHGQCKELALRFLTSGAVSQYLGVRFPRHQFPPALGRVIHQRTDGNPLFMVNVVDDLLAQGVIREVDGQWQGQGRIEEVIGEAPASLRQLIDKQLDRLSDEEQRVLEAASVAGVAFSADTVAAGVGAAVEAVEESCARLARREQFLRARGVMEWPNGAVAGHYEFIHALYQQVVYERSTAGRRIELHRRIGTQKEAAFGERVGEMAAELAVHFAQGRDYRRAVQYLRQAGENAIHRHAYASAIAHFTTGLALLTTLPDTPERRQQELSLQVSLSVPLILTRGYTAPEVEASCDRARELCQDIGDTPSLFVPVYGLFRFYLVRGRLRAACDLAAQLVSLAQGTSDAAIRLAVSSAGLAVALFGGEFATAHVLIEQSMALADPDRQDSVIAQYGDDPGVICASFRALILWMQGYPDQARGESQVVLALARKRAHPFSQVFALTFAAVLHQFRREAHLPHARAEAAMEVSADQGFPFWLAMAMILRGWALAAQGRCTEGIAQIRQGLEAYRSSGANLWWSYFLGLLAEAQGQGGAPDAGRLVLEDALALAGTEGEQPWYDAELYRLKGELLLTSTNQAPQAKVRKGRGSSIRSQEAEAAASFQKAIEIARQQHAKALELRATISLSRLWQGQGKRAEARRLLAPIYRWFTEACETADLREAKALLEELS